MEEVLEHAQHLLVPEGTMLMDVGQQMEAIPLLMSGAKTSGRLGCLPSPFSSPSW